MERSDFLISKEDIIKLYNQGYSINTIANRLFLNNRYIENILNEKEALKVVESVIFDYITTVINQAKNDLNIK